MDPIHGDVLGIVTIKEHRDRKADGVRPKEKEIGCFLYMSGQLIQQSRDWQLY